jgi:hypothetical protein
MSRPWMVLGPLAIGAAAIAIVAACGTDAVGVQTCRQIEEARCRRAPGCPQFDLGQPVHRNSPTTDIDSCIRYYDDACLHGLATNSDPGATTTKACIDAINAGDCDIVAHPENAPACAWLIPPAAPPAVDAAADADAESDAGLIPDVNFPDLGL